MTGPDSEELLRQTYDRLLADKARRVVYQIWKPTWFVVSYVMDQSGYYVMFRRRPAATVSYVLRWPKVEDPLFRPLATAIFNSFWVPDDVASDPAGGSLAAERARQSHLSGALMPLTLADLPFRHLEVRCLSSAGTAG